MNASTDFNVLAGVIILLFFISLVATIASNFCPVRTRRRPGALLLLIGAAGHNRFNANNGHNGSSNMAGLPTSSISTVTTPVQVSSAQL